MIKAANGYLKCQVIKLRTIKTDSGVEYNEIYDPRIRVAEVLEGNDEFKEGTMVYVPMGFGVEFTLREIEYVFVKPEAVVGYE